MKADKPSSTALFVAHGLLWISKHPRLRCEIPPLMAQMNEEMVSRTGPGLFSASGRLGRLLRHCKADLMQRASIPGFYLHFVMRKRCIENWVRLSLDGGIDQLVVIGAGFDTLSLRMLTDYPSLKVIEIDHPATQTWKAKGIDRTQRDWKNLHLVPLDLTRSTMQDTLLRSGVYAPNKRTVFVAEGLLMYLNEEEIRTLLAFIRQHSAPSSRLVFTCMEQRKPGDFQFQNAGALVNFWLRLKRERFAWGLRPDKVAGFLEESEFDLLLYQTHQDFRRELLSGANKNAALAIGENVILAETKL